MATRWQLSSRRPEWRTNLALRQDDFAASRRHLERAVAVARVAGDRAAEARAHGLLGRVALEAGHFEEADSELAVALGLYRELESTGAKRECTGISLWSRLVAATMTFREPTFCECRHFANRSAPLGAWGSPTSPWPISVWLVAIAMLPQSNCCRRCRC